MLKPLIPSPSDDVADQVLPLIGRPVDDIEQLIEEARRRNVALGEEGRPGQVRGLRTLVSPPEGSGYWEVFRISDDLMLSITDAVYERDITLDIPLENSTKIRLLLSGRIFADTTGFDLEGPQGLIYSARGREANRYTIARGVRTTLLVLHCQPDFFVRTMGLAGQGPGATLGWPDAGSHGRPFALDPALLRATYALIESRFDFSSAFRGAYLTAKCLELATMALQQLHDQGLSGRPAPGLTRRDVQRVGEARLILQQELTHPPSIARLARLVGVNQTKLKKAFKETTGQTIHQYVQQLRMERATQLLTAGDLTISEVSAAVGYEYPANFSFAFRKYFGYLPKQVRRTRAA